MTPRLDRGWSIGSAAVSSGGHQGRQGMANIMGLGIFIAQNLLERPARCCASAIAGRGAESR